MKALLFFCVFVSSSAFSLECNEQHAKKILSEYQWYTEDYPPYNYRDKQDELMGIYPEVLVLIYRELNLSINLEDVITVPWARLFNTLENSLGHAAFNMIQTPERDQKFQLVTLPVVTKISIMVLKENKHILAKKNLTDLTYAVVRQDIGEHLLDKQFNSLNKIKATSASSMLNMLIYRRVHAVAYSELVAKFQLDKLNNTSIKLVPLFTLSEKLKTAFVFHKDTPICVTKLFSETISLLDERGEIIRVLNKYQ
jgi:ABC-type amino acid transport substrate-binding protein